MAKTSLGAAAIGRFVAVLLLSLAVIAAGATLFIKEINENLVEAKLAEEAEYFASRTSGIDRSLLGVAIAVRAQLEFSRLLDGTDTKLARARLVSYVQSFASVYPLKLVLVGGEGEVIMRVSAAQQGDLPLPPTKLIKPETPVWIFDDADATLYRLISVPILVNGVASRLLFYTAFDNALLTRNSHPGSRLALYWQGKRVAESVATDDSQQRAAGRDTDRSITGKVNIPWSKGDVSAPILEIHRTVPQPIVVSDIAVILFASGLLIATLGWFVLGSWLRATIGRIMALNAATQAFATGTNSLTDINAKLTSATAKADDEISELSISYGRLVEDIETKNSELNAKLASLRESEERFRKLFDLSPFWITLTELETGRLLETNQSGLSRLGYSNEEAATHGTVQLGIWAEPAERQHFLALLKTHQRVRNFEATFRAQSGALVNAILFAEPVTIDGCACVLSATIDVTELRTAHKALSDSEKRYATIIDAMAEGLVVHDANGLIAEMNHAASDILGVSAAQMRGQASLDPGWRILDTNGEPVPQEEFPSSIAIRTQARVPPTLLKVEHPDKRITWIEITALPLTMAALGGTGALVTIADRTREVEAQSALRHLADTLEHRVTDRTAELAAANAELEAFSYSVSHDLRAPLRGIEGFSKLLLERHSENLNPEGQNYLMRVRNATKRMGAITDDLLSLARVSRTQLIRERIDLGIIANAVAADLANMEPGRIVEWRIEKNLVVYGDPGLLKIAIENLLGNAWKYSAKASSAVIQFGKRREDDQEVELQVSDNGAGFDNAYVAQLFNPFKRLHDSSEFTGTGIGLATVRRVVERHGGSVGAEGEAGKGATFWFRLRKH